MTHYHAVLIDETGCEFGAGCDADSREEAWEAISEDYPESRIVQLESPQDAAGRQQRIRDQIDWEEEHGPVDWPEDAMDAMARRW